MNTKLNDRLVELHHQVAALKVYDAAAGTELNKHASEFENILAELMSMDPDKFRHVHHSFTEHTRGFCRKAAHGQSEHEKTDAFYNGVGHLNIDINHSLEYFSHFV